MLVSKVTQILVPHILQPARNIERQCIPKKNSINLQFKTRVLFVGGNLAASPGWISNAAPFSFSPFNQGRKVLFVFSSFISDLPSSPSKSFA